MSSSDEEVSWVQWYCTLRGNEFLCEVEEDYISDKFNLTGLSEMVPLYRHALHTILDCFEPDEDDDKEQVQKSAEHLYGYIHCRYIMTNRGLQAMVDKWRNGEFQTCQRAYCNNQQMLPIGVTDKPLTECVKLFCPQCNEVYTPVKQRYQSLDGAYFGTGFPHMLFMVYPQLRIKPHKDQFVPKMYGFKIHDTALDVQLEKGKQIENQRKRAENAVYQATKKVQKMQYHIQNNSQKQNLNKSEKVTEKDNKSGKSEKLPENQQTSESKTPSQNQLKQNPSQTLSQKLSSTNSTSNQTTTQINQINSVQNMEIINMENPQNLIWAQQDPPSYQSTQISGNPAKTGADYDTQHLDHAITATERLVLNEAGDGGGSLQ